jgi:hypothetical protein
MGELGRLELDAWGYVKHGDAPPAEGCHQEEDGG